MLVQRSKERGGAGGRICALMSRVRGEPRGGFSWRAHVLGALVPECSNRKVCACLKTCRGCSCGSAVIVGPLRRSPRSCASEARADRGALLHDPIASPRAVRGPAGVDAARARRRGSLGAPMIARIEPHRLTVVILVIMPLSDSILARSRCYAPLVPSPARSRRKPIPRRQCSKTVHASCVK